jgi:hypothetical protein
MSCSKQQKLLKYARFNALRETRLGQNEGLRNAEFVFHPASGAYDALQHKLHFRAANCSWKRHFFGAQSGRKLSKELMNPACLRPQHKQMTSRASAQRSHG